jgi:predicted lipoprotein with Yx(FWY)xxD motif
MFAQVQGFACLPDWGEIAMNRFKPMIAALAVALSLAGCATVGANFSNGVLTDQAGMTLYTFDKDAGNSGKSMCNGPCAANWPPFAARDDDRPAGVWSTVTRDDGSRQWAYMGKPVYRWIKDQKPGDKTGDGVNNAWHVVKQDAEVSVARERSSGY